jgi:hypothetical protein
MGRRPPEDSWERSAQRRARTAAGERSYPPGYLDEPAPAADSFADESDDDDSVVIPAITLPTMRVPRQSTARPLRADQRLMLPDEDEDDYLPGWASDEGYDEYGPASQPEAHALVTRKQQAIQAPVASDPKHVADAIGIVLVPGQKQRRRLIPLAFQHEASSWLKRHRILLSILVMVLVLSGILANTTSALQNVGIWTSNEWSTLAGLAPVAIPSGPNITDANHYSKKYGFDTPKDIRSIPSDEWNRLVFMLPFAMKATAAYDQRYQQSVEPQMLLWWTHAEGIKGRINYSNCANNSPRSGSYFSDIENCPHASFWQLGYGNQFSVIYVLKNAFRDLHGDPNDPKLVQQVGQWVLNYDRSQGTVPKCGGYSCTFPAMTIDQIMSGINTTTGVKTADNWWASVLSRDPGINCYMIAHALTFFNHQATKNWIGNYYYEPYWQYESNRLGDILRAWSGLRKDARV